MSVRAAFDYINGMDNTDAVADYMKELGLKGKPGSACRCIIARYALMFTDQEVSTIDENTQVWFEESDATVTYEHSPIVIKFVQNFDMEMYPELVE